MLQDYFPLLLLLLHWLHLARVSAWSTMLAVAAPAATAAAATPAAMAVAVAVGNGGGGGGGGHLSARVLRGDKPSLLPLTVQPTTIHHTIQYLYHT